MLDGSARVLLVLLEQMVLEKVQFSKVKNINVIENYGFELLLTLLL